MSSSDHDQTQAQRIRLQRTLWGLLAQLCLVVILVSAAFVGYLQPLRVVEVAALIVGFVLIYVALIRSGINLRFRDPSMTAAQVMTSLPPACYAMFHIEEPQVRLSVVLMATIGLLFATLSLDLRRLLLMAAYYVGTYLLTLAALLRWAPERVNVTAEISVVIAYIVVLVLICLLGGFITGLRQKLRQRNARLEAAMAELEDLAIRDPLTRLPNRRAVMEHLAHEGSRVERRTFAQQSLCIAVADVDHFKQINDNHGHQAGDAVLCRISDALLSTLRQADFVGRFGGEEFLLIFPESSWTGARIAADRVRESVANLDIPELPTSSGTSISIGVAVHRPGETVEDTLRRADEALYHAKEEGRDRVVMADPRPEASTIPQPETTTGR